MSDSRGRKPGETTDLVCAGAARNGFGKDKIEIIDDPYKAIDHAFSIVQPGDLIVVQVDEIGPVLKHVMEHFERIVGAPDIPLPLVG